jgi:hypothetical protein
MDYPSMLIAGSLLIVSITFFYLWLNAEGKIKKLKREQVN